MDDLTDNTTTAEQQSQLKLLIARGKEQGYLTYAEVNDHLPNDIVDPEQIEDIIAMINDMGIEVHEFVPDTETLLLNENPVSADDDVVAEEAAAALAAVDSEFGRTTDPVRMYMREMGTVELLTREGEIQIAKRIEEGMTQVLSALASYPLTIGALLRIYDSISENGTRLADVISGFKDIEETTPPLPPRKPRSSGSSCRRKNFTSAKVLCPSCDFTCAPACGGLMALNRPYSRPTG